ncbi:hypothetical protein PTSG_06018 [Salpingoeca rosetta]|uniref:SET domain-containing protein n=1 Tax=Salpingoeca rosetta (strain ATCC 50818 / BSB-021) TaxID=946362 RepID=F2UDF8_SALR5|nr:uncharacterized protein PTSG_06018 [Salpingoeca rosetta]EGD74653.1 hypothetical protein PTSG_06018 [Salpingoeca rosetta]|eukprot:XP_004992910.1 hypothetical protein PTSG_06018 [Salpingoeca rosetta]
MMHKDLRVAEAEHVGQHVVATNAIQTGETLVLAQGWRFNTENNDAIAFLRFIGAALASDDREQRTKSQQLVEEFQDVCPRREPAEDAAAPSDPLLAWVPDVDLYKKKLDQNCFDQGFFPAASKFNHSCTPNAEGMCLTAHDGVNFFEVKATRPIAAGEEVCISYLGVPQIMLPADQRRALLRTNYEFTCACARCTDEDNGTINATSVCNSLTKLSPCCGADLAAMQNWYTCVSCGARHDENKEADERLTCGFRAAAAAAWLNSIPDVIRVHNSLCEGLHRQHWICATLRVRLLHLLDRRREEMRLQDKREQELFTRHPHILQDRLLLPREERQRFREERCEFERERASLHILHAILLHRQMYACDAVLPRLSATAMGACAQRSEAWQAASTLLGELVWDLKADAKEQQQWEQEQQQQQEAEEEDEDEDEDVDEDEEVQLRQKERTAKQPQQQQQRLEQQPQPLKQQQQQPLKQQQQQPLKQQPKPQQQQEQQGQQGQKQRRRGLTTYEQWTALPPLPYPDDITRTFQASFDAADAVVRWLDYLNMASLSEAARRQSEIAWPASNHVPMLQEDR